MNRGFKGIWIPKEIWVSKELSMQEKIFLAEIHSLDNENGCIASNAYFAEFFGLSKSRVSAIISSLCSKGYCKVTLTYKDNKEVDKRVIRCVKYGDKEVKILEIVKEEKVNITFPISNDVIEYLNEKADKKFRDTPSSAKFIVARYKEGYMFNDFKKVIDNKCAQWIDTDFDKFLRPSTLFNATKFQEYLAEKPTVSKAKNTENIVKSQIGFYDV